MNEGYLTLQLKAILGDEGFVRFVQALGGTRVWISHKLNDDSDIVQAVGRELADQLIREMAPAFIRVPLARRDRALYYRAAGLSNGMIARRLGITETGVNKIFGREGDLPERPKKARSPKQLDLL